MKTTRVVDVPKRTQTVLSLLNEGKNQAEIGRQLGLSRETISFIVTHFVTDDQLRVPCAWCGEELPPELARTKNIYHLECRRARNHYWRKQYHSRKKDS